MKPTARFLYWCATLLIFCLGQRALAASSPQGDTVAGGAYGFESAKAYLEMQERDLADAQGKFEKDLFQNLDEANVINIKYRALPPNYVLYRLKLADNIEKNASKSDKQDAYCKEFLYIDNAERENADKFLAYNESMTEKFIPRDTYQVMDEDILRNVLVRYLETYSMVYGFKNPDSIRIRIEKAIPFKNAEGDFGILYSIALTEKDDADDSASEKMFQVSYCNGEIVSFEPSANDAADAAVLKICKSRQ
ncbi:hypothetical protein JMF94_05665 [Desulfovibrio sp. UIB00]|uniref:hypothetical protein n=1 Tax=Desulfovibrio sp. UIB00 TaxID=2804314 RepID=UPI001F0FD83B|nr:hypothetical protein [Desulfovibrio sp. UIB00]MCH5144568.1 hypothetical protein [Desulfovibrio sp. UIB00]